ncbi:hypothetical protein [Herbidospora mongoliensis]|uniref:hypothetical protein n=1 Tax=Herbidospora mongoliensis TaxID=688067 RepID=UPI000AB11737|nr:hypothetical protein [Herbidospora mongoliensis]
MNFSASAMIFIGLFLIGGVWSFARQKLKLAAVVTGALSVLAFTAGVMWWQ